MGDQVWLVAHQFGASQFLVYDYPSLDLNSAILLGHMAHDVFPLRGTVATCSSENSYIVNRKGEKLRTGNFPRGVAVTDDGHLLGMSMYAPAAERNNQHAVLRWYTREWQFRADFVPPGVGMVLDVMALKPKYYSCHLLETWPFAEISRGEYSQSSGGFTYRILRCIQSPRPARRPSPSPLRPCNDFVAGGRSLILYSKTGRGKNRSGGRPRIPRDPERFRDSVYHRCPTRSVSTPKHSPPLHEEPVL